VRPLDFLAELKLDLSEVVRQVIDQFEITAAINMCSEFQIEPLSSGIFACVTLLVNFNFCRARERAPPPAFARRERL
jgi:hypothetical protein